MKAKLILCTLLLLIILLSGSWTKKEVTGFQAVREYVLAETDHLTRELSAMPRFKGNRRLLQRAYTEARRHYKHIEFFAEYVSPRATKYFINGPLVPRYDEEQGNRALSPNGFQRMEEILFRGSGVPDTTALHGECNMLLDAFAKLRDYYSTIQLDDGLVLEMCQYELFRIAAMNLAGFDATITQTNLQESAWCLEGMEKTVDAFNSFEGDAGNAAAAGNALKKKLQEARKVLLAGSDFNRFDRLGFTVNQVNPINSLFVDFHNACRLPWSKNKQPLNLNGKNLFSAGRLNMRWFSMYYEDSLRLKQQAELGKKLFFDPLLSGNGKRSCADCHNPAKAFSDGLPKSLAIDGRSSVARNAPALTNVVYQKAFFADGRVYHLEQQVFEVLANPNEMHSSVAEVVVKLKSRKAYRELFALAFADSPDSSITSYAVQKAITEYEKTLAAFGSRFDSYLAGDTRALNEREINGYNLFEGKALCGTCHFMPLFNGTAPPFYSDSEFEVIGVPENADNQKLDSDSGRYRVTRIPEQLYSFKTPTVRNIELTAPYMHNGAYANLDQVVEFYRKGGGAGLKFTIPNQTLPFDSLQLSKREKEDIILFMKSLTDPASAR